MRTTASWTNDAAGADRSRRAVEDLDDFNAFSHILLSILICQRTRHTFADGMYEYILATVRNKTWLCSIWIVQYRFNRLSHYSPAHPSAHSPTYPLTHPPTHSPLNGFSCLRIRQMTPNIAYLAKRKLYLHVCCFRLNRLLTLFVYSSMVGSYRDLTTNACKRMWFMSAYDNCFHCST